MPFLIKIAQSHHNHASSRSSADAQQSSQVSAAEIMSAAGLAAMAAAELGEVFYIKPNMIFKMFIYIDYT